MKTRAAVLRKGEWSGTATPLEQLPAARERPAVGLTND